MTWTHTGIPFNPYTFMNGFHSQFRNMMLATTVCFAIITYSTKIKKYSKYVKLIGLFVLIYIIYYSYLVRQDLIYFINYLKSIDNIRYPYKNHINTWQKYIDYIMIYKIILILIAIFIILNF